MVYSWANGIPQDRIVGLRLQLKTTDSKAEREREIIVKIGMRRDINSRSTACEYE